jgi:hypothetical protein
VAGSLEGEAKLKLQVMAVVACQLIIFLIPENRLLVFARPRSKGKRNAKT